MPVNGTTPRIQGMDNIRVHLNLHPGMRAIWDQTQDARYLYVSKTSDTSTTPTQQPSSSAPSYNRSSTPTEPFEWHTLPQKTHPTPRRSTPRPSSSS
ncbi:hypothetical protein HGRIS_001045 [Hohenbuehelia grisea]|uniref:Uncharacterized protein n=1 Tax=Hohenbuehelia grisea TaxID=104357 RepID=A0ABR3JNU7_9AGAR